MLVIAILGALSSYVEKYLTTSVAQWVSHDLRRILYHHIQRLSLSYHDRKRTGDLLSRITGDIDSVQDFISQVLLGLPGCSASGANQFYSRPPILLST